MTTGKEVLLCREKAKIFINAKMVDGKRDISIIMKTVKQNMFPFTGVHTPKSKRNDRKLYHVRTRRAYRL